jgi:hypothetical protein
MTQRPKIHSDWRISFVILALCGCVSTLFLVRLSGTPNKPSAQSLTWLRPPPSRTSTEIDPSSVSIQIDRGSSYVPRKVQPAPAPVLPWNQQSSSVQLDSIRDVRAWAERDPEAAIAWVDELTDDAKWEALSSAICLQTFQHNPAEALTLADRFRTDGRSGGLTRLLLSSWAEQDAPAAVAWVNNKAEPAARDFLFSAILQAEASHSPRNALARLNILSSETEKLQAFGQIIATWSGRDITDAARYVSALPVGAFKQTALANIHNAVVREETILEDGLSP